MFGYRLGRFNISNYIGKENLELLREIFVEEGEDTKILEGRSKYIFNFPIFKDGPLKKRSLIEIKYYNEKKLIDEIILIKSLIKKIEKERVRIEKLQDYLDEKLISGSKETHKSEIYKNIIKTLLEDEDVEKNIKKLKSEEEKEILREVMKSNLGSSIISKPPYDAFGINDISDETISNLEEIIDVLKGYNLKLIKIKQEIRNEL